MLFLISSRKCLASLCQPSTLSCIVFQKWFTRLHLARELISSISLSRLARPGLKCYSLLSGSAFPDGHISLLQTMTQRAKTLSFSSPSSYHGRRSLSPFSTWKLQIASVASTQELQQLGTHTTHAFLLRPGRQPASGYIQANWFWRWHVKVAVCQKGHITAQH